MIREATIAGVAHPIVKVKVGDQELPAREADFEAISEPWSEYRLLDGGRLRLRSTVLRVYRIIDEAGKPAYQADGQPFFVVTAAPQVVASE